METVPACANVTFRVAEPKDYPAVLRLLSGCGFSAESAYTSFETGYSAVAEVDGAVVGFANTLGTDVVPVLDIVVDAPMRRQGIGRRLVEFLATGILTELDHEQDAGGLVCFDEADWPDESIVFASTIGMIRDNGIYSLSR